MKRMVSATGVLTLCCAAVLSMSMSFAGYAEQEYESYRGVFDSEYYYDQNPDLQELLGNDAERLFQHFITTGAREGRSGKEDFNLKAYVFYNPDLLGAYKTDLSGYCQHYMERGMAEGRTCTSQENTDGMIGTYTTHYNTTLPRAVNVELAAQRIQGQVIQPGEQFSFGNTVQSRIPQNGYVMAPAIGGNEYGGGICQVSSTLYAAMCHALLPATERHPHSSGVSYLPAGLDATISEGYKDLKFTNIYDKPLRIQAEYNEGALTVSLWLGEAAGTKNEENPTEQTSQTEQSEQTAQEQKTGPGYQNTNTEEPENTQEQPQDSQQESSQDSQQETPQDSQQESPQDSQQESPQDSQQESPQDSQQEATQGSQQETPQDSQQEAAQGSQQEVSQDSQQQEA